MAAGNEHSSRHRGRSHSQGSSARPSVPSPLSLSEHSVLGPDPRPGNYSSPSQTNAIHSRLLTVSRGEICKCNLYSQFLPELWSLFFPHNSPSSTHIFSSLVLNQRDMSRESLTSCLPRDVPLKAASLSSQSSKFMFTVLIFIAFEGK
jgi:hypothetical protein